MPKVVSQLSYTGNNYFYFRWTFVLQHATNPASEAYFMTTKKQKARPNPTITFQPDPDVLEVILSKTKGKPRAYKTKMINESLRIALDVARKADEAAEKARREVINQSATESRH